MGRIGRNEENMGEIKGLDIVITENIILLGSNTSRSAAEGHPEIHTHFVDFIQKNTGFLEPACRIP